MTEKLMFYLIIDTVRGMSYLASCTVLYVFYSLLIMDFFKLHPVTFPYLFSRL